MDDVVCEEDEDDDEMLVVVWWMTEQMLGVAAHTSAAGAWRRRADVTKMYMCLPLHFVATLLHLVVVLVLLTHDVVHSTFLLARAGSSEIHSDRARRQAPSSRASSAYVVACRESAQASSSSTNSASGVQRCSGAAGQGSRG